MKRNARFLFIAFCAWALFWIFKAINFPGSGVITPCEVHSSFGYALCHTPENSRWIAPDYAFYAGVIFGVPILLFIIIRVVGWAMAGER